MKSCREKNDIRFLKKNRLENGVDQICGGGKYKYSFFIYLFILRPEIRPQAGKKKSAISIREMYLFYTERQFNASPADQSPFLKDNVIITTSTTPPPPPTFARINECATQKLNSKVNSNVHPSVSPFLLHPLSIFEGKKKKNHRKTI